jgi:aldehyde dehydrogenase (NAD+)
MDFLRELGISKENYGACSGPKKWFTTKDAGKLDSINPANGSLIASVNQCSESDYEEVISNAYKVFLEWRKVPAPKRGELVRLMADAFREKKDALGSLVALEMGKIKLEGDGEVQEMIDIADFAVGQSRMLYGKTMHSERSEHTAFNFPVAVWAWNSFIAAICGDTVVWKPSSSVPLCAIAVQNICNEVLSKNNYPNIFNLIIGRGSTIGEKMLNDNRISLISFTGSTKMGRHVGTAVAERFGKSILELGGNNAVIVDDTADMKMVIPAIVFGAVGTAGQRCTSTRRIIVQSRRYEDLVTRLIHAYKQVKIGNPLKEGVLMGPLVNEAAVKDYKNALDEIKKAGGQILYGGKEIDGHGFFVEPTIVKAQNNWDIVQEETFAPILYIIPYKDIDEAIALHNDVPQGLSSSLFTTNLKNTEKFLASNGSDCGIANINIGTSGAEIGGAFGGEKETGGGRESGSDVWKYYMRRQTNTINWSDELPLAQGIKFDVSKDIREFLIR